jgi:choloylglycine hydrolase
LLTLINTQYEEKSDSKTNIFAGLFCHYVAQTYDNVLDLQDALTNIAIWGPDPLAQHFVVRDATGASLVIELVGGKQHVYLDVNDGVHGFGIMTNEPTYDWHLANVKHYEWKRTLARQSVAVPGNFYPEERFLRVHMVKSGMEDQGLFASTDNYQQAFALTAQVLNTISVPMGDQYGTDSGETSGEGEADHSVFGLIRDHATPTLYWRDAHNPTFRRIQLKDLDFSPQAKRKSVKLEDGAYFVDMASSMH